MRLVFCVAAIWALVGCQPIVQQVSGVTSAPQQSARENDGPMMHVDIPSRKASALLSRVAVNDEVETWLAVDDISLSFRRGVLVATRGLGFDLMGADARGTLQAIAGQGEEVYRHQMRYLTGDNHSTYLMAGCSMTNMGGDVVDAQILQRFEEICEVRLNSFTNIFWLDARGEVVRFKQWVSPEIGYIFGRLNRKLNRFSLNG